jgi:hypothetical protein
MANKRLPRDIGKLALDKARQTCPVQSGELYRSLYVDINSSGFEFGATVPYASDVEEGTQPVMVAGSYTGKWKRHKRRTKNGTTIIRGHTKTFEGKKPVLINGASAKSAQEWRTRGATSGREGTFFMKKALESSIEESIEKFMASIGATKTRR